MTLQSVIIHRIVSYLEKMRHIKDTKTQDQDKDEKVNDKEPGMQKEGFQHDSPSGKYALSFNLNFYTVITLCLTDCFQAYFDSRARFYFEDYLKFFRVTQNIPSK